MRPYLFVYGTLLPGHAPARMRKVLRKLRPIGRGVVRGRLYDFGTYPGAVLDDSSPKTVTGQVFAVGNDESKLLRLLDEYEGFDPAGLNKSLFVRKQCHVAMLDGRTVKCWIYVYNRAVGSARVIPDGDYKKTQNPPQRRRDTEA